MKTKQIYDFTPVDFRERPQGDLGRNVAYILLSPEDREGSAQWSVTYDERPRLDLP